MGPQNGQKQDKVSCFLCPPLVVHGIISPSVCLYFSLHIPSIPLSLMIFLFFLSILNLFFSSLLILLSQSFCCLNPTSPIMDSSNLLTLYLRSYCPCLEPVIDWLSFLKSAISYVMNPPINWLCFGALSSCGKWVKKNETWLPRVTRWKRGEGRKISLRKGQVLD